MADELELNITDEPTQCDITPPVYDDKMLEASWESGRPVPPEAQTWGTRTIITSWCSVFFNPAALTFGGAMMSLGVNWWQLFSAWLLSLTMMSLVVVLNGMAGPKYGIPFPYFSRSMFGVHGAQFAAISRAISGIGWASIGTWVAVECVYLSWSHPSVFPSWANSPQITQSLNLVQLLLFLLFVGLQIGLFLLGLVKVKMFTYIFTTLAGLFMLGILIWSLTVPLSELAAASNDIAAAGRARHPEIPMMMVWFMAAVAAAGGCSSITLNVVDVCHFVRTQRQATIGHLVGFPIGFAVMVWAGVAFVCASRAKYNEGNIWGPAVFFHHLPPWISTWASVLFFFSIANNNALTNIHPAANDILHIYPKFFTYKRSSVIAQLISIAYCPWYFLSTPNSFINVFINGYALLGGSIVGVMIVDYHIINKRYLDVNGLYVEPPRTSPYYFTRGFRWESFLAIALASAPLIPGFVRGASTIEKFNGWDYMYNVSWLFAFCAAGFIYYVLVRFTGRRVTPTGPSKKSVYKKLKAEPEAESNQDQ